jgi:glucose-6-phosphate-specific signal transduction histidine kinase
MAAAAAAYAACYELTRQFSFSHWILPAGLRLACALLVPRRYWPALLVGETLPVIENAVLGIPRFGMLWGAFASLPVIAPCLLMVAAMQRRMTLYRPDGEINMPMILLATLGAAVITAVLTDAALVAALLSSPGSWPELSPVAYFFAYFLGAYTGALTLTPVLLALRERLARPDRVTLSVAWTSPLIRELLFGAMPVLATLALLAQSTDGSLQQGLRLATALPVVVVTVRHGWHGAAVSGMLASIAMASTASTLMDPDMLKAQVILALALSTALMAGVRVARSASPRTTCRVMEVDADTR